MRKHPMLKKIRKIIEENKNRTAFFKIVARHFPPHGEEYRLIEKAYEDAKTAFRGSERESGERYFEHLRAVALILMEYLRVRDPKMIVAALMHDIVEDIDEWHHDRMIREYGQEIANLIWWVTKPPVSEYGDNKEARNRAYHQRLHDAPREALIIKLCDRLHNMITMWGVDEAKQRRKVVETQDFYLVLAEKTIVLIHELEAALDEVVAGWTKNKTV